MTDSLIDRCPTDTVQARAYLCGVIDGINMAHSVPGTTMAALGALAQHVESLARKYESPTPDDPPPETKRSGPSNPPPSGTGAP